MEKGTGLQGKVALVTGASRGIGLAIAKRLGSAGARIVVNDMAFREGPESVIEALKGVGAEARTHEINVTDGEQVEALFDKTVPVGKAFGVMIVVVEGIQFEVATFREEGGYTDGRHPDEVRFADAGNRRAVRPALPTQPYSSRISPQLTQLDFQCPPPRHVAPPAEKQPHLAPMLRRSALESAREPGV